MWSGPIDGDWNRHRQSLENAIVRLEQHLNISGGTSSFGGRIEPRSPLAGRLKQMLPMQYQSLAGVKGTACLTVSDPYGNRNTGMSAKEMALPDTCQRDLERLMQDGQRNLGLDLIVECADPDHRGHCCITLKLANGNGGVKCLDERLNPLPDHAPLPRAIKDQVSRFAGSAGQFHFNPSARGLEFKTRMPVHLREAVVNASRGSPARLTKPFLKGTVGRGSNAREDVALTKDVEAIAAKVDTDYAICLKQNRVRFNNNAVDFRFLCENLRTLNDNGQPSDDQSSWNKFVAALGERLKAYGEFTQRNAEIKAAANREIVISLKLTAQEIGEMFMAYYRQNVRDSFAKSLLPGLSTAVKISESQILEALDIDARRVQEAITSGIIPAAYGAFDEVWDGFKKSITHSAANAGKLAGQMLLDDAKSIPGINSLWEFLEQQSTTVTGETLPQSERNAIGKNYGNRISPRLAKDVPIDDILKGAGKMLKVLSFINAAMEVSLAKEGERWQTFKLEVGKVAAGSVGQAAGFAVGAVICAPLGPVAIACALMLSLAGAYAGEYLAEQALS